MTLDFNTPNDAPSRDEIKVQMIMRLPDILRHLFPQGHIRGKTFEIGNLRGEPGHSLKIDLYGDKAGLWHDFESGEGGNIFDLWARCHNLDCRTEFKRVLESIENHIGINIIPSQPHTNPYAKCKWHYYDLNNTPIVTVHRYDSPSGKTYRPWDVKEQKWQMPSIRPLYNLPGIINSQHIIFVEGEKAAQALIDRGFTATTTLGGANAPTKKTDWSPIEGKNITIWPDNDETGQTYAESVRKALIKAGAASINVTLQPQGKPRKWDAADAVEEGIDISAFLQDARPVDYLSPYMAYSLGSLLADRTPMPDDLISKRLLTPGGMLVIAGAPKVGKSDLVLSFLVRMAAGVPFLEFESPRPLRILYLQAEIQKPYLSERLRLMDLSEDIIEKASNNLFITPQMRLLLNEDGVAAVKDIIAESFPDAPPDVIVIDPIRNVFDGGPNDSGLGENDNNAMLFFLQERVERLRLETNPDAGIILIHHTRKAMKGGGEDPFQTLSGASSLRGYYSSGMIIFRPQDDRSERCLVFELRNGPGIPAMLIDKQDGKWVELDRNKRPIVRENYNEKLRAERLRAQDQVIRRLYEDALEGMLYTMEQFSQKYEDVDGLGSQSTIQRRIKTAMTRGYIKSFKGKHPLTEANAKRSKYGFLCVEGMEIWQQKTDEETGEVTQSSVLVLPTHFVEQGTGIVKQVENPEIWVYPPDPNDTSSILQE